jgi:hypothetical protein
MIYCFIILLGSFLAIDGYYILNNGWNSYLEDQNKVYREAGIREPQIPAFNVQLVLMIILVMIA